MKYVSQETKCGSNILEASTTAVIYVSLPSIDIANDDRDKSYILLKSLYLTGSIKVLNLP